MKIVLTLSPLERLIAAVERLQRSGKTVERVVVTAAEMEALLNCPFGPSADDPAGQRSCIRDREMYVMGVPVSVGSVKTEDVVAEDVPATAVTFA